MEKDQGEKETKEEGARSESLKNEGRNEVQRKRKEVKRSLRRNKRGWINSVAQEAEDAVQQGQMKGVYVAKRML